MNRSLLSMINVTLSALALGACDSASVSRSNDEHANDALRRDQLGGGQIPIPGGTRRVPSLSGGVVAAIADALATSGGGSDAGDPSPADLGISGNTLGCSARNPSINVRVNQDCTYRRQAEEIIAFNPAQPDHLVSGLNDSRVGFNQTSIAWSLDDGAHEGDLIPPFRMKINDPAAELPIPGDPNRHTILDGAGTFHTYDAASDPGVAFDSQGRAFYSAVAFDLLTNATLIFATTSPPDAEGSFFVNIDAFGRQFVVAEDNNQGALHDKPFITADSYPSSPNRDNVYVTWTVFNDTCGTSGNGYCESPIYGAMSTDHGSTWSTPEIVSGRNASLCFFGGVFTQNPTDSNKCNFSQGSDLKVLPSGDIVVAFNNGNTPATDPNAQQLAVRCHPSGSSSDGSAHLGCKAPTKIGDDVVTGEPTCDFGRGPEECIPGAFIRTNDYPRIAVNTDDGDLFVVWQDYRSGEYDIQISTSTDGGATWSPSRTVNPDTGLDHYFPAVDVAEVPGGSRVGVSYFRTARVPDENASNPTLGLFAPCGPDGTPPPPATSCAGVQQEDSDYVLSGGSELATPYAFMLISPTFPPPDGIQLGFNGDYSGLVINRGIEAHPIWSDTRNVDPFSPLNGVVHDEDVFTDRVWLPNGQGTPGPGTIGSN